MTITLRSSKVLHDLSMDGDEIGMASMQAILCGYYGMGNGGDEALLASLLQMLPQHIQPLVLSGNPEQTRDRYGVTAIHRKDAIAVVHALRQSQVFIWGGGSLIQDATSAISPLYYLGLMQLAQRLGLVTIAWAQGIGPLKRAQTRWLAKQTFQGCAAVSVRDRGSAALLSEWGIPFTLSPDPVWAMESQPVEGLWNLPAPRVAVNLRSHTKLTPARLEHLTQALISFQKATQTCILLVPFQKTQDLAIAQQIQPRLPGDSKILMLEDPHQLKGLFRGVEMAVAMRLHGLIMAAAEECRCFALSYDPKVSQLMQDVAIPGWTLDQIPTDPNEICQTWLDCYANGDPLSPDQLSFLTDRALIHQEVLHKVMGVGG
ncbi:MAG: polysaccharide pyruvyl transferase CsaB [Leptolyngbyaceae cyanobacterium bins.302]|nr:polysaccharide pyruvyl transferase CsaB [Leptolyngbyaceae cyanobacterium bins.302]